MDERELLQRAREVFQKEPRLIELQDAEEVVFVGDTHGDLDATQTVLERFNRPETVVVFLGDYVDRGPHSRENVQLLLKLKLEEPQRIYLLQGNHEGWKAFQFYPADFWEGLESGLRELYAEVLSELPYAVVLPNGVIGLHGALPSVEGLSKIDDIAFGTEEWRQITWGDWQEAPGGFLGDYGGRPQFGRDHFTKQMERVGLMVLVRSHQPDSPEYLFGDRCLTIFTSHAYGPRERTVAIVSLEQKIETARDLILERV
jgi:hypothetical protein